MGRGKTAPPLALSTNNFLSRPSAYCSFIYKEKFGTLSKNVISVFLPLLFINEWV
jgi:hypothetical protein